MNIISGKWKTIQLLHILDGVKRFSELERLLLA
ncbi:MULTISPECIES: winged helix-turn-helix transcriptional regulator [Alphaproteobacteria]|nr:MULTISPECIES: winged helix-turn-helix transcriptional regulator [Alphaproteobacteria]